jgi:polysaccharide biosynthesis/export protein
MRVLRSTFCFVLIITQLVNTHAQVLTSPGGEPQSVSQECSYRTSDGSCVSSVGAEGAPLPALRGPQPITNPAAEQPSSGSEAGMEQPPPTIVRSVKPTEFQTFVADSLGYMLPIYGSNLFTAVPSTFAPLQRIPVPAEYVVGPGDEILIRAWGQIDINYSARVDRNGAIYVPKVGSITVTGLRFDQLTDTIRSAISRIFRNFDLVVSMGQLRSIQIFAVGHVERPGSYTVSSFSTLLNAIFAFGGPSRTGSMRAIQVKRGENVVTTFDLYDLLVKGDKSKDVQLLSGDVIFIPPAGAQVAVAGSVHVPAIYEVKGEGTTLRSVMELAGGMTTTAAGQKVTLERIDNRNIRRVEEFLLDQNGLNRTLHDGDLVTFIPISPRFENAITLRGNVERPGRYPWFKGMRLRDLIPDLDTLVTRAYWQNQNKLVFRDTEHQPEAGIEQRLEAPAPEKLKTDSAQGTSNKDQAVTSTPAPLDQTKVRNDVRRSAPEINWDYALIERLNTQNLSVTLIPFNLRKAVLEKDTEQNLELERGDIITIFSQADMRVPLESQSKLVRLEGELPAAGVYKATTGETLPDVVKRAGGLTRNAYLFGAEFTRESTRQKQQERYDDFVNNLEREVERNASVATRTVSNPENALVLKDQIESQRRLISKLRGIKVKGQIVLEVKPGENDAEALPQIPLEDGDRLVVPSTPSHVNVFGAVYNENAFLYSPDKRLNHYLRQAGGPRKGADKKEIFVIRADGSVVSRRMEGADVARLRLMPGDSIIVPEQLDRIGFVRGLKDFTQILSQFAFGAAAIAAISRN